MINQELSLSIIVPVFNSERFIEKCLKSLFEQDIPEEDYEIIVINDGSVDQSWEVLLRLRNEFKNLILINQENKGVSTARNRGILSAKGRYILFIDSDDYVVTKSLGRLIEKADRDSLDVLFLSFSVYDSKGIFYGQNDYSHLEGKIVDGLKAYQITRGKKEKDPDRSVGIIYKKAFIQGHCLLFLNDVPYLEDGHFVGKVLCLSDCCAFSKDPFYVHIINPGSASNSNLYNSIKARQGFIISALDLRDFAEVHDLSLHQRGLVNHLIAKFIISSIISCIGSRDIKKLGQLKKHLRQLGYNKLKIYGLLSSKGYARSYNFSFWFFIIYYFLETRVRILLNMIKGRANDDISY